jgi:hypothetical protein
VKKFKKIRKPMSDKESLLVPYFFGFNIFSFYIFSLSLYHCVYVIIGRLTCVK